MAKVVYEHVSKRFGDVTALNDLNLAVNDKEFLVLVGPSGCGKTTALRLLAGLDEVSSGTILVDDLAVNEVPPKDRDIAMVFQSYALYPHMTVYDNMGFGLRLRKTPKTEIAKSIKEAADILRIGDLLDRKPKELSGGQRQRIALGRAIVRHPKVFLMDEPLSNLDAKLRVRMRAELIKLHKRLETTFIYVTHDQVEAVTMGARIAVMNHGVLQQLDTPQRLYNEPVNSFVAGFIGSPAMNFFDATIKGTDKELTVDTQEFSLPIPEARVNDLSSYLGKEVVLGIRPEDIHDRRYTASEITGHPISAEVEVVEPMGIDNWLYLLHGRQTFVARVSPRSQAKPGKIIDLSVNVDRIYLFDRKTKQTILIPQDNFL